MDEKMFVRNGMVFPFDPNLRVLFAPKPGHRKRKLREELNDKMERDNLEIEVKKLFGGGKK